MSELAEMLCRTKDDTVFKIRSAKIEDASATLNIKRASIFEVIYELYTPEEYKRTIVDEEKWIQKYQTTSYHLALVAILDNEIIGLIDFSNGPKKRISHTGEFGMSVKKEFRKLGVGESLLKTLIDWASSTDQIEKIFLNVHSTNHSAQSLYQKLGFEVEGRRKMDLKYGPGNYIDTVIMGKLLTKK